MWIVINNRTRCAHDSKRDETEKKGFVRREKPWVFPVGRARSNACVRVCLNGWSFSFFFLPSLSTKPELNECIDYFSDCKDHTYGLSIYPVIQRSRSVKKPIMFSCPNPNCLSVFAWKRNLTSHLRYQCGKQPRFKCPYCDYLCKLKPDIRKHIKSKHPNNEIYIVDIFQPLKLFHWCTSLVDVVQRYLILYLWLLKHVYLFFFQFDFFFLQHFLFSCVRRIFKISILSLL